MAINTTMLKSEMRDKGLSINGLASESGVDKATISRILATDRSCNLETAKKLANALRMSNKKKIAIFFGK